jgi:hypothetical protein
MHTCSFWYLLAAGASLALYAGRVNADMGVPMLFLTLPGMIVALLPIVVIEAIVLARNFKASIASMIKASVLANVASTFAGLPITWLALVALQILSGGSQDYGLASPAHKLLAVTWQAPWLIPYENDLYWMVPAASLALMIPFFFASVYVEATVIRRIEPNHSQPLIRLAAFQSNLLSYGILASLNIGWLIVALFGGSTHG